MGHPFITVSLPELRCASYRLTAKTDTLRLVINVKNSKFAVDFNRYFQQ